MRELHQKLHSSDGASLVFAMLMFLVAAVFSATMVTAALVSARNVVDQGQQNEAFDAVRDAATAFQKEIADVKVSGVTSTKESENREVSVSEDGNPSAEVATALKQLFRAYNQPADGNDLPTLYYNVVKSEDETTTASFGSALTPDTQAVITAKKIAVPSGDVTLEIASAGSLTDDDLPRYEITLLLAGNVTSSTTNTYELNGDDSIVRHSTTETTVSWTPYSVGRDDSEVVPESPGGG